MLWRIQPKQSCKKTQFGNWLMNINKIIYQEKKLFFYF